MQRIVYAMRMFLVGLAGDIAHARVDDGLRIQVCIHAASRSMKNVLKAC